VRGFKMSALRHNHGVDDLEEAFMTMDLSELSKTLFDKLNDKWHEVTHDGILLDKKEVRRRPLRGLSVGGLVGHASLVACVMAHSSFMYWLLLSSSPCHCSPHLHFTFFFSFFHTFILTYYVIESGVEQSPDKSWTSAR